MAVRDVPVHFECAVIPGQWELLEELKGTGFCFVSKELSAGTAPTPAHKINITQVVEASLCLMQVIQAAQGKLEIRDAQFCCVACMDGFPTFMFSGICTGINWIRLTQGLQFTVHVLKMLIIEILIFYF